MKIGIFSGTFDPVHEGHIWLAGAALEQFTLDRIIFLPESQPRRKAPRASYQHRRAMLAIAVQDYERMAVLDMPTGSHSVRSTLDFIENNFGDIDAIKIIMGTEVFENINNWQDCDLLKEKAGFIICLRSEDDGELALSIATKMGIDIEMISSDYPFVSSSKIRAKLAKNKIPKGISQEIYGYIKDNKLYEAL